uniref:Uncharacterized protein n=1 Tax=Rhizophora mucronata TaxID=61149 RepID=A0A2P2IVZ1_RHIMU
MLKSDQASLNIFLYHVLQLGGSASF